MDQSLSQYGMSRMRVRATGGGGGSGSAGGGGFTSGDDSDYYSNNENNNNTGGGGTATSDFDSGVERAERGEQLYRIDKTKTLKKKKTSSSSSVSSSTNHNSNNNNNGGSASSVPTLLEIAKKHKMMMMMQNNDDDYDYDDDDDEYGDYDFSSGKIDEAEYRELFKMPYESAFTKIVTNQVDRSVIEPFLDMNTDAQQHMLDQLMNDELLKRQRSKERVALQRRNVHQGIASTSSMKDGSNKSTNGGTSGGAPPATRFALIEDQLRMGLRREASSCSDLLHLVQLEREITDYINETISLVAASSVSANRVTTTINGDDTVDNADHGAATTAATPSSILPLILSFDDGFYRFLCHGVCQYYGLSSLSVDHAGKRVTMITMPKHLLVAPSSTSSSSPAVEASTSTTSTSSSFVLPSMPLYEYLSEISGKRSSVIPSVDPQVLSDARKHQKLDSVQFMNARASSARSSSHHGGGEHKNQQQQKRKKKFRKSAFGVKQW